MDVLSPDDVGSVMSSPFFVAFWPLLLGGLIILVFMLRMKQAGFILIRMKGNSYVRIKHGEKG